MKNVDPSLVVDTEQTTLQENNSLDIKANEPSDDLAAQLALQAFIVLHREQVFLFITDSIFNFQNLLPSLPVLGRSMSSKGFRVLGAVGQG